MAARQECAACVASRRTAVDAFFVGYVWGQNDAVKESVEADGRTAMNLPETDLCTAHEKMLCEALAARLKQLFPGPAAPVSSPAKGEP